MNFNQALDEWYAHDDWRYADREAAYKFFFERGKDQELEYSYVELLKKQNRWFCLNALTIGLSLVHL